MAVAAMHLNNGFASGIDQPISAVPLRVFVGHASDKVLFPGTDQPIVAVPLRVEGMADEDPERDCTP